MKETEVPGAIRQARDSINVGPPPLSEITRRGQRTHRSRQITQVVIAAAAVVLVLSGAVTIPRVWDVGGAEDPAAPSSEKRPSETPPSDPSSEKRPSETPPSDESKPPCHNDVLAISPGRAGAWHGMATQMVVFTNTGPTRCNVNGSVEIRALAPDGSDVRVGMAEVGSQPVYVRPGRSASLTLGTPGWCGSSPIATRIAVTIGSGPPVLLRDVHVPLRCDGAPRGLFWADSRVNPAAQPMDSAAAAFLQFADGEKRLGPFDTPISLGLGNKLVRTISPTESTRDAAWVLALDGYAQRDGTVSALKLLRQNADNRHIETDASMDEICPDDDPGEAPSALTGGGTRVSIQPRRSNICLNWWSVDLYINDVGQVVGVNVSLGSP